jgi:peptidoglycan hydrolase CwlO-like protein
MLGDIDRSLETMKYNLILTKANGEELAVLSEAYNVKYTKHLLEIDELTFDVPFYIYYLLKHKKVENPNYSKVKGKLYIKLNNEQIFEIQNPQDDAGDIQTMHIKCYSLEYELRGKPLKSLKDTLNITEIMTYLSNDSTWSVGTIDPLVNYDDEAQTQIRHRTFDISSKSWLEFLQEDMCKAFECVLQFNTINKTIDVLHIDSLGENKGLYISDENYLKNFIRDVQTDKIITRLFCYGKDNLSINGVNPIGTFYIEDYSYYIENGYMSTNLVTAINNYNDLISDNQTTFSNYLTTLNGYNISLATKQLELAALKTEMRLIDDAISTARLGNQNYSSLSAQKTAKQSEIDTKQSEINTLNSQISTVQGQITSLQTLLSKVNNFTSEELDELDRFSNYQDYINTSIIDAQTLYDIGKRQLAKLNKPKITYDADTINFLKVIECQNDWDKIVVGDKINIHYPKLNIDTEIMILGYTHESDNNTLKLELSDMEKQVNITDLIMKMLENSNNTQTEIIIRKPEWDGGGDGSSYVPGLQDQINDLYSKMNSQIIVTDDSITLNVSNLTDELNSQSATISIHAGQINSLVTETNNINGELTTVWSEIDQQADRISMVVSSTGNIRSAEIALAISNSSSSIQMIADEIFITPRTNIINFTYGTSIDTSYGDIRLRADSRNYIQQTDTGDVFFYDDSGEYLQFNRGGVWLDGVKVL